MKLVMLTNSYPYGDQEAFIESEIKVLENAFDEIHILTLAAPDAPITRYIPSNAKVTRVYKENECTVRAALHLLAPAAWKEMHFVLKNYGYSLRSSAALIFRFYGMGSSILLKYLEQEKRDDTVFYSYWLSNLSYALTRYKRKHPNAFCVSRAHRVDNFIDFKASLYRREILTKLNGVYPISMEGQRELEQRVLPHVGPLHAELKVFHLGVEFKNIVNPAKTQAEMQVASCSFIHKIKRLDIIIDALAKISDIPISWTHFGGGQDEEQIRSLAEDKLGEKPNIRFNILGQTAHDDILEYYDKNHVDLFINSSDHEGIPVSVMEAMAAGIICTARDVGGNRELISDRENGFLLDKDATAREYASIITEVYHLSENTLDAMKQNAMLKIRSDFASPAVYDHFVEYLLQSFERH